VWWIFRYGHLHFGVKNFKFFDINGMSSRTRGDWAGADKGKDVSFFAILCGRLLWMTSCHQ